jgi:uncharacterized protein
VTVCPRLAVLLAVACVVVLAAAQRAAAQTDPRCTAPADFATQAICVTPALDEFDRMLRSTYQALVSDSSPAIRDRVTAAQAAWQGRRDACRDIPCLMTLYRERNASLAAQLAKPDPASAPRLEGKFYGTIDRGEDETVLVVDDGTRPGAARRQVRLTGTQAAAAIDRALARLHVVVFDPATPAGRTIAAACRAKCRVTGTAEQTERDTWRFAAVTAAEALPDSLDLATLPAD